MSVRSKLGLCTFPSITLSPIFLSFDSMSNLMLVASLSASYMNTKNNAFSCLFFETLVTAVIIFIIIIIINCKWVYTPWQWYYNTQKTQNNTCRHTSRDSTRPVFSKTFLFSGFVLSQQLHLQIILFLLLYIIVV